MIGLEGVPTTDGGCELVDPLLVGIGTIAGGTVIGGKGGLPVGWNGVNLCTGNNEGYVEGLSDVIVKVVLVSCLINDY